MARYYKALNRQSSGDVINERMERLRFYGMLRSLVFKTLIIIIAVFAVFSFVFHISIQKGEGMYPRVRDGDVMLFYRLNTSFEIGDIVTLAKDNKRFTGRIVAKGGDIIDTSSDGKLIINDAIQHEEIYYETYTQGSILTYPYTVPPDSYFILGDMRTGATDSRDIGAVSKKELDGKLIAIIRRRGL